MIDDAAVTMRLMAPSERAFVARSWVSSYATSDMARLCTPRDVWARGRAAAEYYAGQNRVVDRLLDRCPVRVAEVDGLVGAWLCVDGEIVHYVYVRQLYRGEGLVRRLIGELKDQPCVYTHRSRAVRAEKVPRGWRFDPFAAFV